MNEIIPGILIFIAIILTFFMPAWLEIIEHKKWMKKNNIKP